MTSRARTKKCHCGKTIVEAARLSDKQWKNKKFCSKQCKTIEVTAPVKRIIELYTIDELSTVFIGELFGVSHSAISRLLKRNGVEIRKGSRIKACDRQGIIDAYKRTKSSYSVAELYPYSRKTIDLFLKEKGVMIPRKTKINMVGEALKNKTTSALVNWSRVA